MPVLRAGRDAVDRVVVRDESVGQGEHAIGHVEGLRLFSLLWSFCVQTFDFWSCTRRLAIQTKREREYNVLK